MSDWRRVYEAKKSASDAALGCLQSHQRVFIHMAACAPQALIEALCRRLKALRGVEVLHCVNIGPAPYTAPEYAPHCRHNALFVAGNVRQAVQQGRADSIPIFLHEMERMFTEAILPLDVALIQLTPPDDSGHMSLGTSVDISLTAARTARHVIAQVNPRMPRTFGDSFLTVDDVEAFARQRLGLGDRAGHPYNADVGFAAEHLRQGARQQLVIVHEENPDRSVLARRVEHVLALLVGDATELLNHVDHRCREPF